MAITNFQPEIWSAMILANLRDSLIYASLCNRDYEGAIRDAGDTVRITAFNDPSVRAYTKNNDITWDLLTDSQQSLVVDQDDYFAFTVDDVDRRQALGGFVEKAAQGAAYNLADATDTYLSGLMVTAADGGANDLGAKTFDISDDTGYGHLVELRTTLTRAKCPTQGRWVVVPPEVYGALLQDDRFIRADAAGTTEGLRNGFVGRAAGFDVYESNVVPEPTADTYHVIAGHPWAVTFAEQIAKTEALRLEDQFGDGIRGLHLYGGKVVRPTLLAMASVTVAA
jgi:hypothetical protein